jgi:hypothetical protein
MLTGKMDTTFNVKTPPSSIVASSAYTIFHLLFSKQSPLLLLFPALSLALAYSNYIVPAYETILSHYKVFTYRFSPVRITSVFAVAD